MTDEFDALPPTQQLVIEVLIARYRLGEKLWSFSDRQRPAVNMLFGRGLVYLTHGVVPHTLRAGLTDDALEKFIEPVYTPPLVVEYERKIRESEQKMTVQLCPKCEGTGVMSRPPGLPAGQPTWTSPTSGPYVCDLCEGKMVINRRAGS